MNLDRLFVRSAIFHSGPGFRGRVLKTVLAISMALLLGLWSSPSWAALTVRLVNGFNLVVDSNVTSPSTYGPSSAYIGAEICNDSTTPGDDLDHVVAFIGDYAAGATGIFPVLDSSLVDPLDFPQFDNTGDYSLTIEADETGAADGRRDIGTLKAGKCIMEYWLFTYPQCVNVLSDGTWVPQLPPCDTSITGGIKPGDDLTLEYDIWATNTTGPDPLPETGNLTMRNEISASANKIWPNTDSKVPDEYLAAIESVLGWGTLGPDGQPLTPSTAVAPGERLITTQGIWYDLGNVAHGFDNDGDLDPDRNAWLQPVGDPASFDADCFRMVNIYGTLIVKLKGGGEELVPFKNQLYFTDIKENTGVVGLVYYEYIASGEGCSANLTPYQEAASGYDNEKFSADFGLSLGMSSGYNKFNEFSKSDGVDTAAAGDTLAYTVTLDNNDNVAEGLVAVNLGAPDLGVPLIIRETVPAGTTYVAGTAGQSLPAVDATGDYLQGYTDVDGDLDTCTINYIVRASSFDIQYSDDGGLSWDAGDLDPVTDIRWLLYADIDLDGGHNGNDCVLPDFTYDDGSMEVSLPADQIATFSFSVLLPVNPDPVVCNTAVLGVGSATTGTDATDCTLILGDNTISGTVFEDNGNPTGIYGNGVREAGELGIDDTDPATGVLVSLYYDVNGDGQYDSGDLLFETDVTDDNGDYHFDTAFHPTMTGNLPDGPFLVVVNKYDGDSTAPLDAVDEFNTGWGNTTYDPNPPTPPNTGIVGMTEDFNRVILAVNLDLDNSTLPTAGVAANNVDFGFAEPLRLTKVVAGNADLAGPLGVADIPIDEGSLFNYAITLENRLPSVGVQGPTGCEYTVWSDSGVNGTPVNSKGFTNPENAWDATSPNRTVASAAVTGGGLRFLYGDSFDLSQQPGSITKVEGLFFGYFDIPLTDDYLDLTARILTDDSTGTISTAQIESYVGEPADLDPNSAISWDISTRYPAGAGGTGSVSDWDWTDFADLELEINPTKTSAADQKNFFLDAIGVRVTTDADCEAGTSTTLSPVPLQDTWEMTNLEFISADPAPDTVGTLDATTGVLRWDDVGPILPGTSTTVIVTMKARDVAGSIAGECGGSAPTQCNEARTDYTVGATGYNVYYADGRKANDDDDEIAVVIVGKGEIRGTVWNDLGTTGWQAGGGDTGLPNVTVTLFACVQEDGTLETNAANKDCLSETSNNSWQAWATAATDSSGEYEFLGLDTGSYVVEVGDTDGSPETGNSAPYGGAQTAEPSDDQSVDGTGAANGPGGSDNTWGDIDLDLQDLNQLDGAAEEEITGVDFYYTVPTTIYGNVWHDVNGDAAVDPGDDGLSGFTVELYSDPNRDGDPGDGTLQATVTTDADGNYSFDNLVPGSFPAGYVIAVTPPTLPSNVWMETVESTIDTLNNQIPVILTAAGEFSGSHDFGYTLDDTSDIGDTLYIDLDSDGFQDPGEVGIPDVTVWLYSDVDRDGTIDAGVDALLDTDVTDGSGNYLFEDLPRGSYVVKVDIDDAEFPASATATADPDVNAASIGGLIWLDANEDTLTAGEEGIPEVTVLLYRDDGDGTFDAGDTLVAATATDLDGSYTFTGLSAGDYFVDVATGTLPDSSLELTTTAPTASPVTLADNTIASAETVDAGYSPDDAGGFALGSRVWSDANGNGSQDSGEAGIGGVDITVTGAACGSPPCTAVTDKSGYWIVTGLTGGLAYTVTVDTTDITGGFASTTGGDSQAGSMPAAADLMSADFGYRYDGDGDGIGDEDPGDPTGSITGDVFLDADGDLVPGPGEGLDGAAVSLFDADSNLVATTTTSAGVYTFEGVPIGTYSVQAVTEYGTRYSTIFLAAGQTFTDLDVIYSEAAETTPDNQSSVSVGGVYDDLMQDFGYRTLLGSIGDTVYHDVNENADQDLGEPGIAGMTVNLYVWLDANSDGVQDSGEVLPHGSQPSTTTTADNPATSEDESGKYLFTNLEGLSANQYYIVEVDMTAHADTPVQTGDPDADGTPCADLPTPDDPAICDDRQVVPTFIEGTNYLGADFGYALSGNSFASVGDRLWIDTNNNGSADPGELGVGYITVELWNGDNTVLLVSTETDAAGYYVFTGLSDLDSDVGDVDYNIHVDTGDDEWPALLPTTPVYQGGGSSTDNSIAVEINATGVVVSLDDNNSPASNLDADFGYRYAGTNTLSGTICIDGNDPADGYCGDNDVDYSGVGTGESPLEGILVSFYHWVEGDSPADGAWPGGVLDTGDDTFTFLGSASTDVNGDYSFAGLPDDVVVIFSVPESASLDLTTTGANSSVEPSAVKEEFYEGMNADSTVTLKVRQRINLSGSSAVDLDFTFDGTLGGTIKYDFGDLPDGTPDYGITILANNGARHIAETGSVTTSYYLGRGPTDGITTETDGQPDPNADADGGDDGVNLLTTNWIPGSTDGATVTIEAAAAGWIAGWVDFNKDGDFADAGELIINRAVPGGVDTPIDFDIPWLAVGSNQTFFSRFRFYPARPFLVTSTGLALNASFQPAEGEVEDYKWNINVTRVVLASFTAYDDGGTVVVEWETAAEIGTVGFYLNRWDWDTGEYVAVNDGLLFSLLEYPQGGVYSYDDEGALPGALHRYELVEVEASGVRNVYGPFTIDTGKKSAEHQGRALVNRGSKYNAAPNEAPSFYAEKHFNKDAGKAAGAKSRKASAAITSLSAGKVTGDEIKIIVTESGVYYLGFQALADEFGMPVPAVKNWFRSGLYNISNRGEPVAYILAGDESGLFFYGEALDSQYARDNVYLASKAHENLQMSIRNEEPSEPAGGDETFTRTTREERDLKLALTPDDGPEDDYWSWGYVYGGAPPKEVTIRTDGVAVSSIGASLTVELKGATNTEPDPDHHAAVFLNNTQIGDVLWDGLKPSAPTFHFDSALLIDGENTVKIAGLLDTEAPYSVFHLEALELRYDSYYRATDNRLEFSPGGNAAILLDGFTSPDILVFDVTDQKRPVLIETSPVEFDDGTFGVDISPHYSDSVYYAVALDEVASPAAIRADAPSSLRDSSNEAEYVIITTGELTAAARRLANHRSGMKSMVVDLENVYDEFNYGIPSPFALRAFLEHAWSQWRTPPRYVLLAGDGSYDYRDNEGKGGNVVPVKMVRTPHSLYPSDNWFGEVEGDGGAPEIAVGRLPVRSEEELNQVIDKIIAREGSQGEPWLSRLLLLADKPDDAGDFHEGSDVLAALAYPNFATDSIYLPFSGIADARARLFESIHEGRGQVSYIGHGSYSRIANKGLMTNSDIASLVNADRPFVLTAMTCTAGNFAIPGFPSISELLVGKAGGGAAAVWAPTGLSQDSLAIILAESYYEKTLGAEDVRMGDAVLGALKAYEKTGNLPYMMDIYILLGDPAMWLH